MGKGYQSFQERNKAKGPKTWLAPAIKENTWQSFQDTRITKSLASQEKKGVNPLWAMGIGLVISAIVYWLYIRQ